MNDQDKVIVEELKGKVNEEIQPFLRRIIVFGSRVRGDCQEDSDLDIIVLVNEKTPEIEKIVEDIAYQVMWNNDFKPVISMKVFEENKFYAAAQKGFSFYRHVVAEGLTV